MGKVITTEMIISDMKARELMDAIHSTLADGQDDLFIKKEKVIIRVKENEKN